MSSIIKANKTFVASEKAKIAETPLIGKDPTNPQYYKTGKIEVIDFIEDQQLGFHAGNVIKYVCRYRNKNGLEDLKKARWYLNRLIRLIEGGNQNEKN